MVYLLVVRACSFAICVGKGLLQLFWYLLDKSWKGTSRMSLQIRWEPRSSSQLKGQKMLSEACMCPTNTHTHTFSSSFHGGLSPQISFCVPHPTIYFSFSFFLWIQTGFEVKVAFVPRRFVHLPTNLCASTSNFTMTLKKYTRIYC